MSFIGTKTEPQNQPGDRCKAAPTNGFPGFSEIYTGNFHRYRNWTCSRCCHLYRLLM